MNFFQEDSLCMSGDRRHDNVFSVSPLRRSSRSPRTHFYLTPLKCYYGVYTADRTSPPLCAEVMDGRLPLSLHLLGDKIQISRWVLLVKNLC